MAVVRHKEAIHSGHFMISDFEAEAEDEEDMAVPAPEEGSNLPGLPRIMVAAAAAEEEEEESIIRADVDLPEEKNDPLQQIKMGRAGNETVIDLSLNKLFRSMSIAYRQKLTSPKWNRFRGLRLRWKDKIRLNNVIWRCWHMQFIKGRHKLLCAFANPLEIDNHNRTEGGTLLEGKYWKRKLNTVTQQYMKWRMFYKNRGMMNNESDEITDQQWDLIFQSPFQVMEGSKDDAALDLMGPEEDFLMDALFNTFNGGDVPNGKSQGVAGIQFPNPREIQRSTTNADFIQPGLVQLQPSLDDIFMDIEAQPDWLLSKLPTIQESAEEGTSSSQGSSAFATSSQQRHIPAPSKGKPVPTASTSRAAFNDPSSSVNAQQLQQQQEPQQQQQQLLQPPQVNAGVSAIPSQGYPLDLQVSQNTLQRSLSSSDYLQVNQQQQNQQQLLQQRTSQATVMDLASAAVALQQQQLQQQQQQLQPESARQQLDQPQSVRQQQLDQQSYTSVPSSNLLYPGYGSDMQKKQGAALASSTQKRYSPKHRILHQRDYASSSAVSNYETAENLSVQYSPGRQQAMTSPSPYKSPSSSSHINATSATSTASSSPAPHPLPTSAPLEHRARSLSGPGIFNANTSYAGQKRPADTSNADSELVQLLRNSKYTKMDEQSLQQQQQNNLQLALAQQQQHNRQLLLRQGGSRPHERIKVDLDDPRNRHNTLDLSALKKLPPAANAPLSEQPLLQPGQVKLEYPPSAEAPLAAPLMNLHQQALLSRSRPHLSERPAPMLSRTLLVPVARPVPPVPHRDQHQLAASKSGLLQHRHDFSQHALKDQKQQGAQGGRRKNDFDMLRSLIPSLNQQNSSVKISKAALLHKGGDYLLQLKREKAEVGDEIASLRAKIDALNGAIGDLHKTMSVASSSAGGASRGLVADTYEELEQLFDDHVLRCTHQNWKYWTFSLLAHPLLRSFQATVDAASYDELSRTAAIWLDQHLSLGQLRPCAVRALAELTRRTEIVERGGGEGLPERALAEAVKARRSHQIGASPHSSPSSGFME